MKQLFKLGLRLSSLLVLSVATYVISSSNKNIAEGDIVDGLKVSLGVGTAHADVPPVDGWTVAIPGHVVGSGNPNVPVPAPADSGMDGGGDGCGDGGGGGGADGC